MLYTTDRRIVNHTHSRPSLRVRLCSVYILLFLALGLAACSNKEKSQFETLPQEGWIYGDTILFHPCDSDSVALHPADIAIALRHNNKYEYANIWIQMRYHSVDSVITDTFNIMLADNYGNWLGKGIGVSYQLIDTLKHNVPIDINYPIEITHIMRTDTLADIEQVGLIVVDRSNHK